MEKFEPQAEPLPIFVQISETIMREIAAGRLLVGDKLPAVRDMARSYNVAVGTLTKALILLEKKGILERIQGSGNYVRSVDRVSGVYSFFRLELINGGGLPKAQMLSVDRVKKPDDLPAFGTSAYGHRFRRLRLLDDQVAALEEIWLDGDVTANVTDCQLSESLYQFYQDKLGVQISRVEDRVSVAPVPHWSDADFAPCPGKLTPFVTRLAEDQSGRTVEYSRNWFDPALANYVSRIR